jgi:hypothetical protein
VNASRSAAIDLGYFCSELVDPSVRAVDEPLFGDLDGTVCRVPRFADRLYCSSQLRRSTTVRTGIHKRILGRRCRSASSSENR